jgi:membrane-associated phospholipid phosphatase
MGAMVSSAARLSPPWMRAFVWSGFGALAATSVVLLAHDPTDVLAGGGMGLLIGKAVGAVHARGQPRRT